VTNSKSNKTKTYLLGKASRPSPKDEPREDSDSITMLK